MAAISPYLAYAPKTLEASLERAEIILDWVASHITLESEVHPEYRAIKEVYIREMQALDRIRKNRILYSNEMHRLDEFFSLGRSFVKWVKDYRKRTQYQRRVMRQRVKRQQIRKLKSVLKVPRKKWTPRPFPSSSRCLPSDK